MNLRLHVKGLRHGADFLAFGNAAAVAGIRLHKLDRVVFEVVQELPARIKTLAGRERRAHLFADELLELGTQRRRRLLKRVEVILVAKLAELDRGGDVGTAMVFHDDVHIAALFTDGRDALLDHFVEVVGDEAFAVAIRNVLLVAVVHGEVQLHGVVALGHGVFADVSVFLGGASGANVLVPAELQLGSIAADAVVDLAAEQLVDGNIEYLALDVHEGNINGADRRKDNRAAALAPEADFEHALPELVRAHRVFADDQAGNVLQHADAGRSRIVKGDARFAVPVEALVRPDAAANGAPARPLCGGIEHVNVYLGNFHGRPPCSLFVWLNSCPTTLQPESTPFDS